ncbi:MAG: exosortase C-terminal domain/associated protein EpsI [Candidatus Omnitrophota bacterium]
MQGFRLRYIILVAILVLSLLAISLFRSRQAGKQAEVNITGIPLNVRGWVGREEKIENNVKEILETESVLIREYKKADKSVWISLVYYKESRVALHLPESCSIGQGSFITDKDKMRISIPGEDFYANKFVLKGDKGNQVVIYYFETENMKTSSYMAMRWQNMLNKLKFGRNTSALIRFSASTKESSEETTMILKEFIEEAAPLITKYAFPTS